MSWDDAFEDWARSLVSGLLDDASGMAGPDGPRARTARARLIRCAERADDPNPFWDDRSMPPADDRRMQARRTAVRQGLRVMAYQVKGMPGGDADWDRRLSPLRAAATRGPASTLVFSQLKRIAKADPSTSPMSDVMGHLGQWLEDGYEPAGDWLGLILGRHHCHCDYAALITDLADWHTGGRAGKGMLERWWNPAGSPDGRLESYPWIHQGGEEEEEEAS